MKKIFFFIVLFFPFITINAQCAMCKAVVENGNSDMAEALNLGIIYLMIFPYLILIAAAFLFYRNRKKKNVKSKD